ncbi:MAG TPA: SIS domain-containing protein [Candidatus Angelobacter sp.]
MASANKSLAWQLTEEEMFSSAEYFQGLSGLVRRLPCQAIDGIAQAILSAFDEERTVFVFGNGGSAASASHMMCDMNKGIMQTAQNKRLKVIALTDNVPLLTAWANDSSYDLVFSEQLKTFVRGRDVALAISASGNSRNVLLALRAAREHGAVTLGVTGFQGGKMKPLCDICAVVPSSNMQMIEDMHHAILHSVLTVVRKRLGAGQPEAIAAGGRFNT